MPHRGLRLPASREFPRGYHPRRPHRLRNRPPRRPSPRFPRKRRGTSLWPPSASPFSQGPLGRSPDHWCAFRRHESRLPSVHQTKSRQLRSGRRTTISLRSGCTSCDEEIAAFLNAVHQLRSGPRSKVANAVSSAHRVKRRIGVLMGLAKLQHHLHRFHSRLRTFTSELPSTFTCFSPAGARSDQLPVSPPSHPLGHSGINLRRKCALCGHLRMGARE